MYPYIEQNQNSTAISSFNSIPPPTLKYLHLCFVQLENFPYKCIELLLRTFPPAQLEYLSIFEGRNDGRYSNTEQWFSILTMPVLKLKRIQLRLTLEEETAYLIDRLRQHFGNKTQVIQLENDPHLII